MIDGLMPRRRQETPWILDEATCLLIQLLVSNIFNYKSSHIVLFEGNATLNSQN